MKSTKLESGLLIRPARTSDVAAIRALCQPLIDERILVPKDHVNYFENIQEFMVVTDSDGTLVGCAALHVFWEDLAEVRTVATSAQFRRRGVGRALIETIERDPLFLRAPRVVIPASINALHFYQELGYAFAPGGDRLDEEQLYCLEKFPQRSV